MAAASNPRLWLIEGIPGSGKSTLAARLCAAASLQGLPARWWLEEASDHPVLPSPLRRAAHEPGYAERCLRAFEAFLKAEQGVLILEGAAFQSTVRFMFALALPRQDIEKYIRAWDQVVASASPRLLAFQVAELWSHYADFVHGLRGPTWTDKLITYVERTPIALGRGWSGFEGFVAFWTEYQALCADLMLALTMPVQIHAPYSEGGATEVTDALTFFVA